MTARQAILASPLYDQIEKLFPIIVPRGSDSSSMDNVIEFLTLSGYPLAHAI